MTKSDSSRQEILGDILEKIIDCQIANTQVLSNLQTSVSETNVLIREVASKFTNGFRTELKDHITQKINEQNKLLKDLDAEISKAKSERDKIFTQLTSFKKVGFWFKVIAGFLGAIAVIAVTVVQILKLIYP